MDLVRGHPTFVVLGDSAAFGTGDEIDKGKFRGWAGFLADAFHFFFFQAEDGIRDSFR